MPQADQGGSVRIGVVVALQQRPACRLGVRDPACEHERLGALGDQPVAAGVVARGQDDRPFQQVRACLRRAGGRLAGGADQPVGGQGVAGFGPARELLGHPKGGCPGRGQAQARLAVQPDADPGRQIVVDGVADEVVPEAQVWACVGEDQFGQRRGERRGQLGGRPAGRGGQLREGELRTQNRGGPQHVLGVVGQGGEPAQDRQSQRRGQLRTQRAEQLGDVERMAARPPHLCEDLHRRRGAEDVGHEVADGLVGEGLTATACGRPLRPARPAACPGPGPVGTGGTSR